MKISEKQLRSVIQEIIDHVLSEGAPSGAVDIPDSIKRLIMSKIEATRHGIQPPDGGNYIKFTIDSADRSGVLISAVQSTEFTPDLRKGRDDRTIPSGYDSELERKLESALKGKVGPGRDLDTEVFRMPFHVHIDY